jgi:hypothetical protein
MKTSKDTIKVKLKEIIEEAVRERREEDYEKEKRRKTKQIDLE